MKKTKFEKKLRQWIGVPDQYTVLLIKTKGNPVSPSARYYGIKGCQYLLDGSCDGHVGRDSELPRIALDENRNIVEGCLFEALLNVMGLGVKDLVITDISKRIDPDMFKSN